MKSEALPTITDLRGNVITIKDLPPPTTVRWVPHKKAILVLAVKKGLISRSDLLNRYNMDEGELKLWEEEFQQYGIDGLKITKTQTRRK